MDLRRKHPSHHHFPLAFSTKHHSKKFLPSFFLFIFSIFPKIHSAKENPIQQDNPLDLFYHSDPLGLLVQHFNFMIAKQYTPEGLWILNLRVHGTKTKIMSLNSLAFLLLQPFWKSALNSSLYKLSHKK